MGWIAANFLSASPLVVGVAAKSPFVRLAGSPAEVLEKLGVLADNGAERFYLQVLDLADLDHLRLVAEEVLPESEEVLPGGVANAGSVVRVGTDVLRPTNPHSAPIHRFLRHLRAEGFEGVPEVVGVEPDGRERLVRLAKKGTAVLKKSLPYWKAIQAQVVSELANPGWSEIQKSLDHIKNVATSL